MNTTILFQNFLYNEFIIEVNEMNNSVQITNNSMFLLLRSNNSLLKLL